MRPTPRFWQAVALAAVLVGPGIHYRLRGDITRIFEPDTDSMVTET